MNLLTSKPSKRATEINSIADYMHDQVSLIDVKLNQLTDEFISKRHHQMLKNKFNQTTSEFKGTEKMDLPKSVLNSHEIFRTYLRY